MVKPAVNQIEKLLSHDALQENFQGCLKVCVCLYIAPCRMNESRVTMNTEKNGLSKVPASFFD